MIFSLVICSDKLCTSWLSNWNDLGDGSTCEYRPWPKAHPLVFLENVTKMLFEGFFSFDNYINWNFQKFGYDMDFGILQVKYSHPNDTFPWVPISSLLYFSHPNSRGFYSKSSKTHSLFEWVPTISGLRAPLKSGQTHQTHSHLSSKTGGTSAKHTLTWSWSDERSSSETARCGFFSIGLRIIN